MRDMPSGPDKPASHEPSLPLFRQQAIDAAAVHLHGEAPGGKAVRWPAALVMLPCLGLVLWLCFGSYTRTAAIGGALVPRDGQVSITTVQEGEVVGLRALEGASVQAGQVLFELRSARASASHGATEAAVAALLQSRRRSLQRDQWLQRQRDRQREAAAAVQRQSRLAELSQADTQLTLQRNRVALAEQGVRRYLSLQESGFVSLVQLQERQADLLDQQQRLAELERSQAALRHALQSADQERLDEQWRSQRELEATQRELASLDESAVEAETRRAWLVRAPHAGVLSNILAVPGQNVAAGATLAWLLPATAVLEAELFAPSRAAGFLQPGLPVRLRYQAYPYQKFGLQEGRIREVSATTLHAGAQGEPVYRVRVSLGRQSLVVQGRQQALRAGALVDANVLLDRRRLYEWLLEPLYALRSRG
jgi:membrane fusion protein